MPNTTVNLAIPYALDADARAAYPGTSKALAERIRDLMLTPSHGFGSGGAATVGHGASVVPNYTSVTGSGDFTYSPGVWTYTGPTRAFIVAASADMAGGSGPLDDLRLTVRVNGGNVARSVTTGVPVATLAVCLPVFLPTGATIDLVLYNANAASADAAATDIFLHVMAV